jgi:glycosyltransferase involved in cell wall biosynthesis
VVVDGETGFIVSDVEEMASAVQRVARITADACRDRVADHYSCARMANAYEALYGRVLSLAHGTAPAADRSQPHAA